MSKKLLLGLILCVGLQAINAAAPVPAPVGPRTATEHRDEAWQHFHAIGTNAIAAWYGAGRTIQSVWLTGKHTGLFALAYSRETATRATDAAANAGARARDNAADASAKIKAAAGPITERPATSIVGLTAIGLGLYYTPRWILKKAAECTTIFVLGAVAVKAMERKNQQPAQL